MRRMSGKALAKLVERRGWKLLRIHGSHTYGRQDSINRLSTPVQGNTPLKTGPLKQILKMAEIDESEAG